MRYDEPPPWSRRKEGWWSQYGRAVRWFGVMYAFTLLPLVILFFVDTEQALEKAKILGIGIGAWSLMLPAVWWYNRRDGAETLESLNVQRDEEHQHADFSRHSR
ncbi:hypothetical protein [Amycolatopsis japonica]